MKYVIIGNGIAGTTAAETIRSFEDDAIITLITNEPYPLYSRISVSLYASGKVSKENLIIRKLETLQNKRIDFIPELSAKYIDQNNKQVLCFTLDGDLHQIPYDKLLIATGGTPRMIEAPGSDGNGIFHMHSLDDGDTIYHYAKDKKKAVVSGGSFIGIDFVSTFLNLNLDITFLIRGPRFMHKLLDTQASEKIQSMLKQKGVQILTGEEISVFHLDKQKNVTAVETNQGKTIAADIVGLGLGINRISDFIKSSSLNYKKGLITNEYLQTLHADIFAAGDVAEYYDVHTKDYSTNGDWFSARSQGIVAGKNMVGMNIEYNEVSSNTINVFGTNVTLIECVTDPEAICYVSDTSSSYRKIFTKDNFAIGGIVIGDNEYVLKLKTAIKDRRRVLSIDI